MNDDRLKCFCCNQVHEAARLVTLPNGEEVGNYSQRFREVSEALQIANYPTLEQRRRVMFNIEKKRGAAAAARVKQLIRDFWQYRKK